MDNEGENQSDDDAAFFAQLPSDPVTGRPRATSRVVTRLLASPTQLFECLLSMSTRWIWRGQCDFSWHLEPRLARDLARLPPAEAPTVWNEYIGLENRLIGYFKEQARRSLAPPPDELDLLGWLAVMQHYGAPTRLLDWSESPFVALWFAYESARAEDAALWALNAYLCRSEISGALVPGGWDHLGVLRQETRDAEGNTVMRTPALEVRHRDRENRVLRWAIRTESRWPLPVIPFDTDARMTTQRTVLTCIGDLRRAVDQSLLGFGEWRSDRSDEQPPGRYKDVTDRSILPLREPADLILKLRLPRAWRTEVLTALTAMGIDASTVFPGLDGVGRQTSMYFDRGHPSLREVITDSWVGLDD